MADRPAATPDFTFFESVAALAAWDACDANPLHISNTPLLTRTTAGPPADGSSPEKASSTRMLVCHDFKGGYHAYEGPQGIVSAETVYTCEYLQFVDIFVYFAHKRVAIPPAAWINYMHKNGVKVLGTFIVEGDNGSSELREIFQPETENTVYHAGHYANQLASIAETYGFDGWLLNFESRFPREIFDFPIFSSWLDYLRDELHRLVPGSQLMWYDALTIDNNIRYQNGLTDANKPLFDICDGIFTNYWWRERQLSNTARVASALGRPKDVFAGVDVWGRGTLGNGGFNVGEALASIKRYGLAVALFAPGWTYEYLGVEEFWKNERKFWVGDLSTQHNFGYGPIAQYVEPLRSGGSDFFYTNFSRGFGKGWWIKGEPKSSTPWVHLSAQSVLPTFLSNGNQRICWNLEKEYAYSGAWSLAISRQSSAGDDSYPHQDISVCPLYKLGLSIHDDTSIDVRYLSKRTEGTTETGIYIDLVPLTIGPSKPLRKYLPFDDPQKETWCHMKITSFADKLQVKATFAGSKIVELGVYCKPSPAEDRVVESMETLRFVDHPYLSDTWKTPFVYLGEISISRGISPKYAIHSISKNITSYGETQLSWKVTPQIDDPPEHLQGPYSGTTGPFSNFIIYCAGEMQGLAFATKFTLKTPIGRVDDQEFSIDGVMWDGTIISSSS